MIDLKSGLPVLQKIRLDWRAYWKEFSRNHGDYPVKYRGVLLFRDGWTYSSTSYEGPEWPPPTEPRILKEMIRAYWVLRKREVRSAWWVASQELLGLQRLQSVKSIPLQQVGLAVGEDGKAQRVTGPIEVEELARRVGWMREDLDECERNLHDDDIRTAGDHQKSPARSV